MKREPDIVTPTAATRNPFAAFTEKEETINIPKEEFLPNPNSSPSSEEPQQQNCSAQSDSSISSMSSLADNLDDITQALVIELMEGIKVGCATAMTTCTHTDVTNFQEILGDALSEIPAA